MLLSLQSTGPDYSHLQANINIPWNCEYIEYHVASINTRDLLITTEDDAIEFEYEDDYGYFHKHKLKCLDLFNVSKKDANSILTWDGADNYLRVGINTDGDGSRGRTLITPLMDEFKFTRIDHRAGLVTGLYNMKLNTVYPANDLIIAERPIRDYANKLYLVSKQGQAIQSNIGDIEYTPSVIASIDHIIDTDTPIIQNFETYGKPIKNIVNIDSFKQIDLQLVDFQYQPVVLASPMFVTIKVKPCDNPKMKLH